MDKSANITSPITNGTVKFLFSIPNELIIENYRKEAKISIEYILKETENVSLYQCEDTGYRFFHPFTVAGDGPFYEKLEEIPWYYAAWKWDYEIAQKYIAEKSTVLDIGCGEAKFLKYLQQEKKCICSGLELNEKAKDIAVSNGLNVKNELIQDHVTDERNKYDVVTFFQVLEHINEVRGFLNAAVKATKSGGKIILAVPNNEPYYLTYDKYHFLNLPPHHMGWWDQRSLTSLEKYFPIKLERIEKQPLEHYSAYTNSFIQERLSPIKFLKPLLYPALKVVFFLARKRINGASIMAIYTKV